MPVLEFVTAIIAYETLFEKTTSLYYKFSNYWYGKDKKNESIQTE